MSSTAQVRRSSKSSVSGSLDPCASLGYRRLAARVITQALHDLKGPSADERRSAQAFLDGSAMLDFWCDLAEVRMAHVVACAARVDAQAVGIAAVERTPTGTAKLSSANCSVSNVSNTVISLVIDSKS
jgi:hypothetical protein